MLWLKKLQSSVTHQTTREMSGILWPVHCNNECDNPNCLHRNGPKTRPGKYACNGLVGDLFCLGTYIVTRSMAREAKKFFQGQALIEEECNKRHMAIAAENVRTAAALLSAGKTSFEIASFVKQQQQQQQPTKEENNDNAFERKKKRTENVVSYQGADLWKRLPPIPSLEQNFREDFENVNDRLFQQVQSLLVRRRAMRRPPGPETPRAERRYGKDAYGWPQDQKTVRLLRQLREL